MQSMIYEFFRKCPWCIRCLCIWERNTHGAPSNNVDIPKIGNTVEYFAIPVNWESSTGAPRYQRLIWIDTQLLKLSKIGKANKLEIKFISREIIIWWISGHVLKSRTSTDTRLYYSFSLLFFEEWSLFAGHPPPNPPNCPGILESATERGSRTWAHTAGGEFDSGSSFSRVMY